MVIRKYICACKKCVCVKQETAKYSFINRNLMKQDESLCACICVNVKQYTVKKSHCVKEAIIIISDMIFMLF